MPISEPYRNIQLLGFNRARISVYVEHNNVRGKHAKAFQRELEPLHSRYYVAVMISGGDLLGRLGYTS